MEVCIEFFRDCPTTTIKNVSLVGRADSAPFVEIDYEYEDRKHTVWFPMDNIKSMTVMDNKQQEVLRQCQ